MRSYQARKEDKKINIKPQKNFDLFGNQLFRMSVNFRMILLMKEDNYFQLYEESKKMSKDVDLKLSKEESLKSKNN
ncbi:MAG: hypothetical protein EZS28_013652 [Streblomastix strix]|uniref:Uncharacterized protein n=1 Tax=Streblomastix strix TaxID=222440 RepID=A0A5J4W7M2_9EUKA|nr:MAG: hypothetical protein EZS28_013652 [Streblomastix strix]